MRLTLTYITITYNAADVLQRTLDSVLQQDYDQIVHLIIDGGSTDGTLQMVNDYIARNNSRADGHMVQVTSEPDHGIYDAMNKGLRSATGDYVCFLNAGDTLPSPTTASDIVAKTTAMLNYQTTERQVQTADAKPQNLPAVLYGDTDITDANGQFLHHRRLSPPEKLSWLSFRKGMLVCHQAFYARTDFAVANPFDTRYRYSADVDWCIRIMHQSDKEGIPMLNLHTVVANYMQEGTTTRHHRESLMERFHIMRHHYGLFTTLFMHFGFLIRTLKHSKKH